MQSKDSFILPDGTITKDSILAAESWAEAFYQAKEALAKIRNIPMCIVRKRKIVCVDEILAECDRILAIREK